MTPQELIAIGERLYGARWKTPFAQSIGVSRETISRMTNGHRPIARQVETAARLLDQAPNTVKYKERRFSAKGESVTLRKGENWAHLIHCSCVDHIASISQPVHAIVTDPIWPKALDCLAGSDNPYQLLADVLRRLPESLDTRQIVIQLRCDGDPRILCAIPHRFPFLRFAWLPYAVPSPQGRLLISGDVGYVFGTPPKATSGKRLLPGQPHPDYCPLQCPPKAQPIIPAPEALSMLNG
ncbi:MAG: hypothetical protein HC768_21975 [Acaryochloris sp. CRU_2_0]|nr:hypothetical protein [Acaryochloris sp. CRU_2_0]